MPGNPCPADCIEPRRVELPIGLMPNDTAASVPDTPVTGATVDEEVVVFDCGLSCEGFCGATGAGAVWELQGEADMPAQRQRMDNAHAILFLDPHATRCAIVTVCMEAMKGVPLRVGAGGRDRTGTGLLSPRDFKF